MSETDWTVAEVVARWKAEAVPGDCATGRYRCRYYDWGDGPPVVFVHGLSDRAVSFAAVMSRLAGSFRCIAYELAEGGPDGARVRRYRHEDYAADLIALCDHLRLGRADLFAASFGTTVALRAVHDHPARFGKAVLQGAFARRPLDRQERALALLAGFLPLRMSHLPGYARVNAEVNKPQFYDAPADVWEWFLANSGSARCPAVGRRGRLINGLDLRPLLPAVRTPLLLVGGDADRTVPKEYELEVLAGVPGARRVELAGCGHFPQFTRPGETARLVGEFLAG